MAKKTTKKRMGRPPKPDAMKDVIRVRVDAAARQRIDHIANRRGLGNDSAVIRTAIDEMFEREK